MGRGTSGLANFGSSKSWLKHHGYGWNRRTQRIATKLKAPAERGEFGKGGVAGGTGLTGLSCIKWQRDEMPGWQPKDKDHGDDSD